MKPSSFLLAILAVTISEAECSQLEMLVKKARRSDGDRRLSTSLQDSLKWKGEMAPSPTSVHSHNPHSHSHSLRRTSICGAKDNREYSSDNRIARMSNGCTASLVECPKNIPAGHQRHGCFMTCSHCGIPTKVEFGQLKSKSDGTYTHADDDATYEVDPNSVQSGVDEGSEMGSEWMVFGVKENDITGMTALEALNSTSDWKGKPFVFADTADFEGNPTVVTITGYGTTLNRRGARNGAQKTHKGTWLGSNDLDGHVRYLVDTTGGNSGSPVYYDGNKILAIHTHRGCTRAGLVGEVGNSGTGKDRPEFQKAWAAPLKDSVLEKSAKYTMMKGKGWCADAKNDEATSRRFLFGAASKDAKEECNADPWCVGFARSPTNNKWGGAAVLYTTKGCTDGCTNTKWQTEPERIVKGHASGEHMEEWEEAHCWKKIKPTTYQAYAKKPGYGWCLDSRGQEATARRFVPANLADSICFSDPNCVAWAGPSSSGQAVLYTTTACTSSCRNTEWVGNRRLIAKAGFLSSQPGWSEASCFVKK